MSTFLSLLFVMTVIFYKYVPFSYAIRENNRDLEEILVLGLLQNDINNLMGFNCLNGRINILERLSSAIFLRRQGSPCS